MAELIHVYSPEPDMRGIHAGTWMVGRYKPGSKTGLTIGNNGIGDAKCQRINQLTMTS